MYCGAGPKVDGLFVRCALVIEHLVPRSRGGDDSPENTAIACHRCNSAKANLTPLEYVLTLERIFWRARRPDGDGGWCLHVDWRFTRPSDGRARPYFYRDLPRVGAPRER